MLDDSNIDERESTTSFHEVWMIENREGNSERMTHLGDMMSRQTFIVLRLDEMVHEVCHVRVVVEDHELCLPDSTTVVPLLQETLDLMSTKDMINQAKLSILRKCLANFVRKMTRLRILSKVNSLS